MFFEKLQSQPKRAWGLTSWGAFDWRRAKAVDLGAQRRKGGRPPAGKNGLYGFASRTRTLEKGFQVLQSDLKTFVGFVVVRFLVLFY